MRESIKNNLSQLIEHAFQQFAQLPAYNFNEKSYSYSELDSISQTIANHLKEKYPNQIYIGVYAVKSFETFASIIGIIRAGKAFVPISPKFPPAKLQRIIEKSKIKTLIDLNSKITQQQKHTVYPAVEILNSVSTFSPQGSKVQPIEDTKPAYLLFTSGTTGDPKGVSINRNQLKNYLINISKIIPLQSTNRCSQTFELNFDLSIHDIFHTLIHGSSLFIPEENDLLSLGKYIQKNKISHLFCVPSLIKIMDKLRQIKKENLLSIEAVIFCGEALTTELVEKIQQAVSNSTKIINLYGPTESTIAVAYYIITNPVKNFNGIVSIGKIFKGNDVSFTAIENSAGLYELTINGNQVISNYFGEENDASKFYTDINGLVWYKTGDLVRKDEEDLIYFAGRIDEQIKWNGHRIETGEIEHYARNITGLEAVCFILPSDSKEQLCLVLEGELTTTPGSFRVALNNYLPAQLLPQQIVSLPQFPLNSNGKTDRKKIIEIISLKLNG